jgi:transcriptional regulator with XRE-family HTH domain
VQTSILKGLGPALRWLRDRRGRKQYQVANTAGITKGMLSAYETGRQRPSLDTLDKVLDTLGCNLNDLHNALRIVNGEPGGFIRADRSDRVHSAPGEGEVDIYDALGIVEQLPEQEEKALSEMLQGFHRLLRFLHVGGTGGAGEPGAPWFESASGAAGDPEGEGSEEGTPREGRE